MFLTTPPPKVTRPHFAPSPGNPLGRPAAPGGAEHWPGNAVTPVQTVPSGQSTFGKTSGLTDTEEAKLPAGGTVAVEIAVQLHALPAEDPDLADPIRRAIGRILAGLRARARSSQQQENKDADNGCCLCNTAHGASPSQNLTTTIDLLKGSDPKNRAQFASNRRSQRREATQSEKLNLLLKAIVRPRASLARLPLVRRRAVAATRGPRARKCRRFCRLVDHDKLGASMRDVPIDRHRRGHAA
jgi:hypothetical protein